ncbi:hypothetical protein GCM10010174_01060 [Kutzneria viridogrisea]|uniref:Uncharacterized protein n=2 Tax=Kutzneria TaxID=43356 RepID=W5WI02_9PSEU|nr:DUF6204 family protein [Kutzneria albida]AHH97789.1 hypothetical protein KALB_4427 [Kutzneria albida DSM 43870]MBA8924624.1 hypothetical protein [Kutzneria viridogrisea]
MTYRVRVQGVFDGLTEDQRTELLAELPTLTSGGFSPEGGLVYDSALRAFTFRYELDLPEDATERLACTEATALATARLQARGYGHRALRASAVDMSQIKIRRR